MEHPVHQLAQGREGPVGQRRQRHQRQLRGDGPVLRDGALHQHQDLPAGVSNNWGYFGNAEFDKLIADARTSFDDKARDAALAKLHARIVEEAPFVWIAHDVGPRAMSAKVKGVVQPRSWFIDIAPMTVD